MLSIWMPILPKHIWQNVSPKAAGSTYANKPPIVGTGPFQCVEFKKGDFVEHGRQQALLPRRARTSTRSSSRTTRTPTR